MTEKQQLPTRNIAKSGEVPNLNVFSPFQLRLGLIESRGSALLNRDLGPLPSLIPKGYQSYFDVAVKAVTHEVRPGLVRVASVGMDLA